MSVRMPVKQRKTPVTVIPTTRFKSKVKSATAGSKSKPNQTKCGYGVKTSSNSQEGGVRKRPRPAVTKSRPGYSLYATDSEEQIGEVDKGLTKCANIVKQMLEVRKGRTLHTTSEPPSDSSEAREATQIVTTSPRQMNRSPIVIPTDHGTNPYGNVVNIVSHQRQPIFNTRLATSTPDPDKMENSTENLEKVAGYFRKTAPNPSSVTPGENARSRNVQKTNPPQGHFLQQILNADQQSDKSVSPQQSVYSPMPVGVPQGAASQPLLYRENLAQSQNFQSTNSPRYGQDFQREIPITSRNSDNSRVYFDNTVKSNYQSSEKNRQSMFIQPGPVAVHIPPGIENTLDESDYHQLPSPQSLFQGYRGVQPDQSPHLQTPSLISDTIPVLRQSEGFTPHGGEEINRTNTTDSLQTPAKNFTYAPGEEPVRGDLIMESGFPNGQPSCHHSNHSNCVKNSFQREKISNQTFTSPEKNPGRTDSNAPGFNNMSSRYGTSTLQTRPYINESPSQPPEKTYQGQTWSPFNQVEFHAARATDQTQHQAVNSVNQNVFQPWEPAGQSAVHNVPKNHQAYVQTTGGGNRLQDGGLSNQNVFHQSMLQPNQTYSGPVSNDRPGMPINRVPASQGTVLSNVHLSDQQAPVNLRFKEHQSISNPSTGYRENENPHVMHTHVDGCHICCQHNAFPIENQGKTNVQMRPSVSVDYGHCHDSQGIIRSHVNPNVKPNTAYDVTRKALLLSSDPGTDIRAEIDKAIQPLLAENKHLRSNLRTVSEQMKDLEREWTNQQLRQKDMEKDSTNQRLVEAEKPLDSSGSSSRIQSLELDLEHERARADKLETEYQRCQPELEQYKNDRQKLLHVLQEKDSEKLRLRLSNQSEVRNLHAEVELQQKQAEAYRLQLEASEKETHILRISLKQRDSEIDRLQELVLTMKTSMSELIRDQHISEGASQFTASFNLQRLERLLREGNPNSEDLDLLQDTVPFEPRQNGELSVDRSLPLTVYTLAEHDRTSPDKKTSKLKKDDELCEEIEDMILFNEDEFSLDETMTETTTTVTSNQDSTISTIKDGDCSNDIHLKNANTPQKKTVHFEETNTVDDNSPDDDLDSVISEEPSRYSVTDYFNKYPIGASNTQKSYVKGHHSSNTLTAAPQVSGQSEETSEEQESSLKGDNALSSNKQAIKHPPPRPPPPLRNPLISQDNDGNSTISGITYSSVSTAATVDESVFRAGLANLDANIARLQESLQQKKALLSS